MPMLKRPDTNAAVHRLLLRSLEDLDGLPDHEWGRYVERLCQTLEQLDPTVGRTMALVVRADLVIRQLLLDLLVGSPGGAPLHAVIAGASSLLVSLEIDDHATEAGVQDGVSGEDERATSDERR
jgi:hypothetical protein